MMSSPLAQDALQIVLNEKFESLRLKNSAFSLRAFAKKLAISPAALSEIMRGKRQVSQKIKYRLATSLELSPSESQAILGEFGGQGILAFQPAKKFTSLSDDHYKVIADWECPAILALAETSDFIGTPAWIGKRLNISNAIAKKALERLAKISLLTKNDHGVFITTGKSFCTAEEIPSAAVQKSHLQNLELAATSLERDDLDERDFRGVTMAIDPKKIPQAKKLIGEFVDRLAEFMEDGKKEEVYMMGVQLFPLTKKNNEFSVLKKPLGLLLIGLASCLLSSEAMFAAFKQNNGGAIVQGSCDGFNQQISKAEVLDFFEMRYSHGFEPVLGAPDTSVDAKIEIALKRLSRLDSKRAALYRQWAAAFEGETVNHPPLYPFPPLKDIGDTFPHLPSGCVLVRVISQNEPATVLDTKRYLVRREIFDSLDNNSKAGLILHELIYRDAIAHGHETSIQARVFTGFVASDFFEGIDQTSYDQALIELGMEGYMTPAPDFEFRRGAFGEVKKESWHKIFRYFDHLPLSFSGAVQFCLSLKGESRIVEAGKFWRDYGKFNGMSDFAFDQSLVSTPIGKHVLGPNETRSAIFWTDNASACPWSREQRFPDEIKGCLERTQYPQSTPLPFFCIQDIAQSPWTEPEK